MAAGMSFSFAATISPCRFGRNQYLSPKRSSFTDDLFLFSTAPHRNDSDMLFPLRSSRRLAFSFVMRDHRNETLIGVEGTTENGISDEKQISAARLEEKLARKRSERFTYLIAAMMSSFGITSMAIAAVYLRFSWQMEVFFFFLLLFPCFLFLLLISTSFIIDFLKHQAFFFLAI